MRRRDDEKERNIKNAVVQLILEQGFQGASIAKIAKAAGVSPATVYIYYENKDAMLRDIYREYTQDTVQYLLRCLRPDMPGKEIIAELVRQYYFLIVRNREVFHFIEQFSSCPALRSRCECPQEPARFDLLLSRLKERRIVYDFDNDTLYAVLFSPVKAIAVRENDSPEESREQLEELIYMIQKALIRDF